MANRYSGFAQRMTDSEDNIRKFQETRTPAEFDEEGKKGGGSSGWDVQLPDYGTMTPTFQRFQDDYFKAAGWSTRIPYEDDAKLQDYQNKLDEIKTAYEARYGRGNQIKSGLSYLTSPVLPTTSKLLNPEKPEIKPWDPFIDIGTIATLGAGALPSGAAKTALNIGGNVAFTTGAGGYTAEDWGDKSNLERGLGVGMTLLPGGLALKEAAPFVRKGLTEVPVLAKELVTSEVGSIGSGVNKVKKVIPPELIAKAADIGLDVEAIEGIAPGETWVAISGKPGFSKLPNETVNNFLKFVGTSSDEGKAIRSKLLGGGKSGLYPGEHKFIPFKTVADAQRFIETGDASLIAQKIELKGQPWSPAKIKATQKVMAAEDARNKPINDKIAKLKTKLEEINNEYRKEKGFESSDIAASRYDKVYGKRVAKIEDEITSLNMSKIRPASNPPLSAVPEPAAKEPWQMTREEYFQASKVYKDSNKKNRIKLPNGKDKQYTEYNGPAWVMDRERGFDVVQALSEGKSVPESVLKDYPDLARQPRVEGVTEPPKATPEKPAEATVPPKVEQPVPAKPIEPPAQPQQAQGAIPPAQPPAVTAKAQPPSPRPGYAGNIKLDKFPEAIREDIQKAYDAMPAEAEAARRGEIPFSKTEKQAYNLVQLTGGDVKKLVKKVGSAYTAEESRALAGALVNNIDETQKLVGIINSPNGNTPANLLKLAELKQKNILLQLGRHGAAAETGRALSSYRMINAAIKANTNPEMEAVIKKLGGRENLEGLADVMAKINWKDPVQVTNFIRSIDKPGMTDYINEIFINSILSGPKTHMVNGITNTINMIMSPVERGFAAGVEKVIAPLQRRNPERFFAEIPSDVYGAVKGIPEGFKGALENIKTGQSPMNLSKYEYRPTAFSGVPGRVINIPTTALEVADNFGYSMNFRQALNANALRMGKSQGLKGQELVDFVAKTTADPPVQLIKRSADTANYRLFRQDESKITDVLYKIRKIGIDSKKIHIAGKTIETGRIEPLRYVIPFVRTPVNILSYGLERSPLGLANIKMWKNLASKNPEFADQMGRVLLGTMIAGGIAYYFGKDKITGAAPTSPNARDRFYREGKQAYSIKIGDKWYSYQRLEPFNQVFTQVAIVKDAVDAEDKDISGKVGTAVTNIGKNFVSQTYMSGLADIINAIDEPEKYGAATIQSIVTALAVPASSGTRTVAQALDRTIRQPQGLGENIQSQIPGLSQGVESKLNVFGENVQRQTPWFSPINISQEDNSRLNTELNRLDINIGFVGSSISNVKLTPEQQRQYQIMAGGMVKQAIIKTIQSPVYLRMTDVQKTKAIQNAADNAKEDARNKLIREFGIKAPASTTVPKTYTPPSQPKKFKIKIK